MTDTNETPAALPQSSVTRPTDLAQWTIIGLLGCIVIQTAGIALVIALAVHWPQDVWQKVAGYLGVALIILCVAQIIGIVAFLSPMIGTIKISGAGVNLDIDGERH